jgi:hypothetical protein
MRPLPVDPPRASARAPARARRCGRRTARSVSWQYRQTHAARSAPCWFRGCVPRCYAAPSQTIDAATRRARLPHYARADYEKTRRRRHQDRRPRRSCRFWRTYSRASSHPRAYAAAVMAAAARHHIDPDLLFAVMRVESVFDRRIVSYAGAIGLMQIMPRTANLIANRLGRDRFHRCRICSIRAPTWSSPRGTWPRCSSASTADCPSPSPPTTAARTTYGNGSMATRAAMPLDAFLERIPFEQTYQLCSSRARTLLGLPQRPAIFRW